MKENQQEIIFKLSMFEQQIQQLQQQIQAVEQSIVELQNLSEGFNELKNSEGKKIMAMIGRGIFIKSKITSEDLLVDVGGQNFVKKSVPETQKLINEQVGKLKDARESLNNSIEEVSHEAEKMMGEFKGE
ncbi:MAG: prefoldin subunit alpha [Candidatus Pacearchaeota archaeon]